LDGSVQMPKRDGDLADAHAGVLVGQQPGDAGEDALPGGVELVAGDLVDGGAQPVLGDPVVAGGGAHGAVRHQLAQHVGLDPGVGVPLGPRYLYSFLRNAWSGAVSRSEARGPRKGQKRRSEEKDPGPGPAVRGSRSGGYL
jgi:hypothetical protein